MLSTVKLCILVLLVLAVASVVVGAPSKQRPPCRDDDLSSDDLPGEDYEIVDQRQNGTENYRLNMNGVVLVWAPADALLAGASALGGGLLDVDLTENDIKPPQAPPAVVAVLAGDLTTTTTTEKYIRPTKNPKLRLPSFILPYLSRRPMKILRQADPAIDDTPKS